MSTTGDDVSTTSVTDNKAPENIEVEFHSTVRRFVQVSLEGNRSHHSSAKVRVSCHMREKKTVSKLTVSKAKAAKKVFRKVEKVAKKTWIGKCQRRQRGVSVYHKSLLWIPTTLVH